MAPSRVIAGLVAVAHGCQRREISAGGGTEIVNGAGHRFTNAPAQGHTAQWCRRGTAHAHQLGRQRLDESCRHPATVPVVNFVDME